MSIAQWKPLLMQAARGAVPIEFLLHWVAAESGGEPCATGVCLDASGAQVACSSPAATFNREAGLFQLWFKSPVTTVHGTTSSALRAACAGTSGRQRRALSPNEQAAQVQAGVAMVLAAARVAAAQLTAVGAQWPQDTADFWSFVKLQHALPLVAAEVLPLVARALGRPPANWNEFQTQAEAVPVGQLSPILAGYRQRPSLRKPPLASRYHDTLANARAAGDAIAKRLPDHPREPAHTPPTQAPPGAGPVPAVLTLLALGAAAYATWRFVQRAPSATDWRGVPPRDQRLNPARRGTGGAGRRSPRR